MLPLAFSTLPLRGANMHRRGLQLPADVASDPSACQAACRHFFRKYERELLGFYINRRHQIQPSACYCSKTLPGWRYATSCDMIINK